MKHFLLVIAVTVGLSVKAQDKAIDYYYPEGVTQFIDIGFTSRSYEYESTLEAFERGGE